MAAESCPLGYECDDPSRCVQFGLGLNESMIERAEAAGLTTHESGGERKMRFLSLCSGPVSYGLNERAIEAVEIHPRLQEEGFEAIVAETAHLQRSFAYMEARDGTCRAEQERRL